MLGLRREMPRKEKNLPWKYRVLSGCLFRSTLKEQQILFGLSSAAANFPLKYFLGCSPPRQLGPPLTRDERSLDSSFWVLTEQGVLVFFHSSLHGCQ